jgi:hypothetical protein
VSGDARIRCRRPPRSPVSRSSAPAALATVGGSNGRIAYTSAVDADTPSSRLAVLMTGRGQVTFPRVVTVADLGLVNAQIAQVVTATNFLKDVNASGTLTVADKGITNTQVTKALPAP